MAVKIVSGLEKLTILAGQYDKARKADLKLTLVYINPDFKVYRICYGKCT